MDFVVHVEVKDLNGDSTNCSCGLAMRRGLGVVAQLFLSSSCLWRTSPSHFVLLAVLVVETTSCPSLFAESRPRSVWKRVALRLDVEAFVDFVSSVWRVLLIGLGCTTHPTPRTRITFILEFVGVWCLVLGYLFLRLFVCFNLELVYVPPRLFVATTWKFSSSLTFGVYLGAQESFGWRTGSKAVRWIGGGRRGFFLFSSQASSRLRVCLPLWFAPRRVFRSRKSILRVFSSTR